jgi:hypothetical protein
VSVLVKIIIFWEVTSRNLAGDCYHSPEDSNPQNHRHENLKPHTVMEYEGGKKKLFLHDLT